ncbi:MAG: hypothetical protein HGA62_04725 [Chlorobiaceae bacterium]|nr:hypothetical protein [Chlorobiaceae bacterium]NTV61639.1 hypothetical protein [Chlorobiaceae bacterium]
MTTKNETLHGIQARIEELQKTIAEKEKQIKARTRNLKEEIAEELSPEEIVKKHPFLAAGTTFTAGLIITKSLGGRKKNIPSAKASETTLQPEPPASRRKGVMYAIGLDMFHSLKDIGFSYLQGYLENRFKKQGGPGRE